MYLGGVKFSGGIDMGDGGGERDGDLGGDSNLRGGEGALGWWRGGSGGDGNLVGGDCDVEGHGEGDLGGGDLCLFQKARTVLGESGGELVLQGKPHVVVCPCFSLDL